MAHNKIGAELRTLSPVVVPLTGATQVATAISVVHTATLVLDDALVTRKRAEAQAVTDVNRQKVAPRAEWSAPDDPPMLATSKTVANGEADADEIHGGSAITESHV